MLLSYHHKVSFFFNLETIAELSILRGRKMLLIFEQDISRPTLELILFDLVWALVDTIKAKSTPMDYGLNQFCGKIYG